MKGILRVIRSMWLVAVFGLAAPAAPGCGGSPDTSSTAEDASTGTSVVATSTEDTETHADPCDVLDCNDSNPCTTDHCTNGACQYDPDPGTACDDENACTDEDQCQADGNCAGETTVQCNDDESCTTDVCDAKGGCSYVPVADGEACTDGDACSVGDGCLNGICTGSQKGCPDLTDPCLVHAGCEPLTGECLTREVPDGGVCDDDNKCTTGDVCTGGACAPTGSLVCDDGNDCTDDSCTPKGGCVFAPSSKTCNDDDACTLEDTCKQGQCQGEALVCTDGNPCTEDNCNSSSGCVYTSLEMACEDGNACTVNDKCENGQCTSGELKICDDSNECTTEFCELSDGTCTFSYNSNPCDDGSYCTSSDGCTNGLCGGVPVECADSNPCTGADCDPLSGCLFSPINTQCDDGNLCTENDQCDSGACSPGLPVSCDDGDPCTTGACFADAGCVHTPNALPCNDGSACTSNDTCSEGVCIGGPAVTCDDNNGCTFNSCEPALGCVHPPNDLPCDDGNECTLEDTCTGGACVGTTIQCDDANPCTEDLCAPGSGCAYITISKACEDGNPCTVNDKCESGQCITGEPKLCDDGNECTSEYCVLEFGDCTFANNENPCDDSDLCTDFDTCTNGVCVGEPAVCDDGNLCTEASCDPGVGCQYTPVIKPCDDGDVCTAGDVCDAGACTSGSPLDCDDNNPCTSDACVPETACTNEPNALGCDDNDACTSNDLCTNGVCVGTSPVNCDDANPCTDNSCHPVSGCVVVQNAVPCSDGDPCTLDDACLDAVCVPGPLDPCDDNDPCTDDACIQNSGCTTVDNAASCDDGNACTAGDTCSGGTCFNGPAVTCDDGNPCTDDGCEPASGCVFANNGANCDDESACTIDDTCTVGQCIGGPPPDCTDTNPCTDDSCNPASGCTHEANALPCDDQSACTTSDACTNTSCLGGPPPPDCDDNNPCTDDGCDPVLGCIYAANAIPCDDEDACTIGEVCSGEVCGGGAAVVCDDGLFCNGAETCASATGCVDGADPTLSDSISCTTDTCDELTNTILHAAVDAACDDGLFCTGVETCDAQTGCVPGAPPGVDDGVVCTTDGCDEVLDTVVHIPDDSICDLGELCVDDICDPSVGGCQSTLATDCCGNGIFEDSEDCDDGNAIDGDGCSTSCAFEACGLKIHFLVDGVEVGSLFSDDTLPDSVGLRLSVLSSSIQAAGGKIDDLSVESVDGTVWYTDDFSAPGNWLVCSGALGSATISNGVANADSDSQDFQLTTPLLPASDGVVVRMATYWAQSTSTYQIRLSEPPDTCGVMDYANALFTLQTYAGEAGDPAIKVVWGNSAAPDFTLTQPWQALPVGWHNLEVRFEPACSAVQIDGTSCNDIVVSNPNAIDALYWIDPDGVGGSQPFKVLCNMTTAGGGWTLVSVHGLNTRPNTWSGNAYPRPGASFYGKPVSYVMNGAYNDGLSHHSVDASKLWNSAQGDVLLYIAGQVDDYITGTLPKTCNYFDGSTMCTENTHGPFTLWGSDGIVLTNLAYACTTANEASPWESDPYDEFGLHLIDGIETAAEHCHTGNTGLGKQNKGRIFTTFESSILPSYWGYGVHSSWTEELDQPGAMFIR